jgi:hypothetical protein
MEEFLEVVFLMQSMPKPHNKNQQGKLEGDPSQQTHYDSDKNVVLGPRRGLTPRQAGWPTVDYNITLTLRLVSLSQSPANKDVSMEL